MTPLLKTTVLVKCPHPEKGGDVDVKDNCLAGCDHFLHLNNIAGIPQVCCIFPKYKSVALREAERMEKHVEEIVS